MGFLDLKEMPDRTFEDPQNVDVPEERQIKCKCDLCGGNIYYGDKYYQFRFNNICNATDCKAEFAETLLYPYQKYAI